MSVRYNLSYQSGITEEMSLKMKLYLLKKEVYGVEVEPIDASQGGGYLVTALDLPDIHGEGEDVESAFADLERAIRAWLDSPL